MHFASVSRPYLGGESFRLSQGKLAHVGGLPKLVQSSNHLLPLMQNTVTCAHKFILMRAVNLLCEESHKSALKTPI